MKELLPWLVHWVRRVSTIDFQPAFAALVSLVRNIIFLTAHFFTFLVPIAQQPGVAVMLGRLSLYVSAGEGDVAGTPSIAGDPNIAVPAVVVVPSVVLWAVSWCLCCHWNLSYLCTFFCWRPFIVSFLAFAACHLYCWLAFYCQHPFILLVSLLFAGVLLPWSLSCCCCCFLML